jgi:hypothetical protein
LFAFECACNAAPHRPRRSTSPGNGGRGAQIAASPEGVCLEQSTGRRCATPRGADQGGRECGVPRGRRRKRGRTLSTGTWRRNRSCVAEAERKSTPRKTSRFTRHSSPGTSARTLQDRGALYISASSPAPPPRHHHCTVRGKDESASGELLHIRLGHEAKGYGTVAQELKPHVAPCALVRSHNAPLPHRRNSAATGPLPSSTGAGCWMCSGLHPPVMRGRDKRATL